MSNLHSTFVTHHSADCKTAHCNTKLEVHCACGWAQGCSTIEGAEMLKTGHENNPSAPVISETTGNPYGVEVTYEDSGI